MNIEHEPRLSSAELGYLWGAFLSDGMSICMFKYFLQHVKDPNIKTVIEHALELSEQQVAEIRAIFQAEEIPVPVGFTDEDVNLKAKQLYSDFFCLKYIKHVVNGGLITHGGSLARNYRQDVLAFNSKSLNSAIELNKKVSQVLLEKGLASRPPYLPYPKEIEFIHKQSFLWEMLGKRPLMATEVTNLYVNALTNNIGATIAKSFAQAASSKEVKEYSQRGAEIATKHMKVFQDYLENLSLSNAMPLAAGQDITESDEAPFSDKLMMFHLGILSNAGAGNYGASMSSSMRSDLIADYTRLTMEVIKFAEDGTNIMINNGWLERPPLASYKEKG